MLNIYCWRCGTGIEEHHILGLGQFDPNIGKYKGKGFIAFNCPKCSKTRYQIMDSRYLLIHNKANNQVNKTKNEMIDIDQVIDFYKSLDEIDTIEGFLKKCSVSTEIEGVVDKPILQPIDVCRVYNKLNSNNMQRLMILTLNKDNYILSWDFLGEGLNYPISYEPKIIFQTAFLLEEKTSVIIAQNITNNFPEPTQRDILLTKRLIKAGKVLDIDFLDHIVIRKDGFYSYDQLNYI